MMGEEWGQPYAVEPFLAFIMASNFARCSITKGSKSVFAMISDG
jgi:hypothetical protein